MLKTNTRYTGFAKHHNKRKFFVIFIIVIIVAAAVVYLLFIRDNSHPIAIKQGVGQESSSSNKEKQKINPSSTPQGGATDNNGQTSANALPPESEWATSNTGIITLQTPVANSTIHPGDKLIGKSSTSTVGFVLLDDKVGQIASGRLNVVNGQFSGTLQFQAHATTGKLDIYSPNPSNGAEENFLAIPVKF